MSFAVFRSGTTRKDTSCLGKQNGHAWLPSNHGRTTTSGSVSKHGMTRLTMSESHTSRELRYSINVDFILKKKKSTEDTVPSSDPQWPLEVLQLNC